MTHAKVFGGASDLIWAWTGRTIRGRYQQSALGWLWAVVQPLATVAIFTIVFTRFVPVDTGDVPYVLFSYTAVAALDISRHVAPGYVHVIGEQHEPGWQDILSSAKRCPLQPCWHRLVDFSISAILLVILVVLFRMPLSLSSLLLFAARTGYPIGADSGAWPGVCRPKRLLS